MRGLLAVKRLTKLSWRLLLLSDISHWTTRSPTLGKIGQGSVDSCKGVHARKKVYLTSQREWPKLNILRFDPRVR